MGPDVVVVQSPVLYEYLGFSKAAEDFAVEQFITQLAIEGLDIT